MANPEVQSNPFEQLRSLYIQYKPYDDKPDSHQPVELTVPDVDDQEYKLVIGGIDKSMLEIDHKAAEPIIARVEGHLFRVEADGTVLLFNPEEVNFAEPVTVQQEEHASVARTVISLASGSETRLCSEEN